jgi:excisionase family DNA binding protein
MVVNKSNDTLVSDKVNQDDQITKRDSGITTQINRSIVIQNRPETRHGGKDIFTADEASYYLGISKQYLYKLVQLRLIPYHKPGGKVLLFLRNELVEWVCTDGQYKGVSL